MKKQPLSSLNTQLGHWAEYVNTYTTITEAQGFASRSIQDQIRVVTRFIGWLRRMQIEACSLDETIVHRFFRHRPNSSGAHHGDRAALDRFLQMLRSQGTTPAKKQPKTPLSPKQRLISNYERYLLEQRGLTKATVGNYVAVVFTFNGGKGNDATAIDPVRGVVVGQVPLGGKPETAQTDGHGHIFVNIEDKSELSEIDAQTLKVMHTWPLAPCKNPSGQAIDVAHSLLIIGCHNGLMEFWDYANAKVAGTVPIGKGVDANRFDPQTGLAFASCGDGTITVAHQDAPDKFSVVQTVQTMKGARTMALDTDNHNIYSVTSEFGPPPPATPQNPHPWPTLKPGTFTMMIFSR